MTDEKEGRPWEDASPGMQDDAAKESDEKEEDTDMDSGEEDAQSQDSQEEMPQQEASSEDGPSDGCEELRKENEELKNRLQRVQAEFENFRKRAEKERDEQTRCATEDLLHKLLPVMDNIDLAMNNSHDTQEFVKGTTLIFEQLKNVLSDEGLAEIEAEGKTFDPRLHQALLTEDSEEDNKVLQVMQKGYTLNGRVLRHAKVKVGKKPMDGGDTKYGEDSQQEQEDTKQDKGDEQEQADQQDTGEGSD